MSRGFSTALRILADVGKPTGEREDLINDLMNAASKISTFENQLVEALELIRAIHSDNQIIKAMLADVVDEPVMIVEANPQPNIKVKPEPTPTPTNAQSEEMDIE